MVHNVQQPQVQTARRFIDFQLSLQAIISGAVAVGFFMLWMGWQAAVQTSNTEQLKLGVSKLEKRFDEKDTKIEDMRDKLSDQRSTIANLLLRVDALERVRK